LGYMGAPELVQEARDLEEAGRRGDVEKAKRLFDALESDLSVLVSSVRSFIAGNPDLEPVPYPMETGK